MKESNNWVSWRESALGKFSSSTLRKWRKRHHHQPPILRRGIHWEYGRDNINKKVVLINSALVTPEFVAKYYHRTRPCGSGSGELTKDEVLRMIELVYDNKVPDYLIPVCKKFGIPIPSLQQDTHRIQKPVK